MEPSIFFHKGLFFRIPSRDDLDAIQRLRNEETTWIHLGDPRPVGPADQKAWFEGIGWKSGKMYFVVYDVDHFFIGLARLDEFDTQNRSIRVGLDIVPELRGQGYGKRTYEALKSYLFKQLNVNRIWLCVLETNVRAIKIYRKSGFKIEGAYREAIFRNGKYTDYIIMSILKREYRG